MANTKKDRSVVWIVVNSMLFILSAFILFSNEIAQFLDNLQLTDYKFINIAAIGLSLSILWWAYLMITEQLGGNR